MGINLNAIHAVSTQGMIVAVLLAIGAGFAAGHFYKIGGRTTGSIGKGGALSS